MATELTQAQPLEPDRRKIDFGRAIAISLASSSTGSALAAAVYVVLDARQTAHPMGSWFAAPVITLVVAIIGAIVAVPAGLIIGIPLLVVLHRTIDRWPSPATVGIALLGSALAYSLNRLTDTGVFAGRMMATRVGSPTGCTKTSNLPSSYAATRTAAKRSLSACMPHH